MKRRETQQCFEECHLLHAVVIFSVLCRMPLAAYLLAKSLGFRSPRQIVHTRRLKQYHPLCEPLFSNAHLRLWGRLAVALV